MSVAVADRDWSSVTPTTAVVELAADVEGVDPVDLESLYEHVDPGALESLLANDSRPPTDGLVRFTFDGYLVTIRSDGSLVLFA